MTRRPIWDAVAAAYFGGHVTRLDRARVGRIVKYLEHRGATPAEIAVRRQRLVARWGDRADTPEALVKWWPQLDGAPQRGLPGYARPDRVEVDRSWEDARRRLAAVPTEVLEPIAKRIFRNQEPPPLDEWTNHRVGLALMELGKLSA